jgi:hypothetical protein
MEVFDIAPADTRMLWLKAVYVPDYCGYGVMLSSEEPDKFLAALDTHVGRS